MLTVKSLLNAEMKRWLQKSIASELFASNMYKHIANQLQRLGYFGAQKYFLNESSDELKHYQGLVDFVNDMGDVAQVPAIEAIKEKIESIEDALGCSYEIEMDLLNQYKEFYNIAEEKYPEIGQFLLQYLEIQRTSVGEYGDLIARYNRCNENAAAILEFDEFLEDKIA